jgi:hypothetical protein
MAEADQLDALARLHRLFEDASIEYWLFGGWAVTPLRDGRAGWAAGAFERDVGEVGGVRARVISRRSLRAEKSEAREDAVAAAKDRADVAALDGL